MKKFDILVLVLLLLGGLNWGVWGVFEFDIIGYVFDHEWLQRLIYIIWGFCAIYLFIGWNSIACRCKK
jgi:uncharacterized protein